MIFQYISMWFSPRPITRTTNPEGPSMLGAQLDDLSALAGQLDRTGGAIADCQSRSTSETNEVVESVRTAATTALQHITAQMDALRESVRAASTSSTSAQWTGGNAERFRAAYQQFDASMQQAEATTKGTGRVIVRPIRP